MNRTINLVPLAKIPNGSWFFYDSWLYFKRDEPAITPDGLHNCEKFTLDGEFVSPTAFGGKVGVQAAPLFFEHVIAIAVAARDYRAALTEHQLNRTDDTQLETTLAWSKLCWMLEARAHGWDPKHYESES